MRQLLLAKTQKGEGGCAGTRNRAEAANVMIDNQGTSVLQQCSVILYCFVMSKQNVQRPLCTNDNPNMFSGALKMHK